MVQNIHSITQQNVLYFDNLYDKFHNVKFVTYYSVIFAFGDKILSPS